MLNIIVTPRIVRTVVDQFDLQVGRGICSPNGQVQSVHAAGIDGAARFNADVPNIGVLLNGIATQIHIFRITCLIPACRPRSASDVGIRVAEQRGHVR